MSDSNRQNVSASGKSARVIDGKAASEAVIDRVKSDTQQFLAAHGFVPGLAVILVGDNPASHVYVRSKERVARACGFYSVLCDLPEETSQIELLAELSKLNSDPAIHGILVQLPLPAHLDSDEVIAAISPCKDVDGLHVVNAGKLASGDLKSGLVPCTPAGAMELLRSVHGNDLSGLNAVVIGRSNLFGKPMAQLLLNANATVSIAHSRTADLPSLCRTADILVAAVGRAGLVKGDWIKPGTTVIDVGINQIPAPERGPGRVRLVGDVDFEGACEIAGAITPVPGGVGPMTIAMLMVNTLLAAQQAVYDASAD